MKFSLNIHQKDFEVIKEFLYKPHSNYSQKQISKLLIDWFGKRVTDDRPQEEKDLSKSLVSDFDSHDWRDTGDKEFICNNCGAIRTAFTWSGGRCRGFK